MKKFFLVTLALFAVVLSSTAQSDIISLIVPSGQRLYFSISHGYNTTNSAEVICPTNGPNGWSGYQKPAGDVVIPDSVMYEGVSYPVTTIGKCAFLDCDLITSIVIPNTVTWTRNSNSVINTHCGVGQPITGCTSLTSLTIGRNFCSGQLMNGGSPNLKTIYFNADSCINNVITGSLGADSANNVNLIIGDNVKIIPPGFFSYDSITNRKIYYDTIIIGSSVNSIGSTAFNRQYQIQSITFRSQNPPLLEQYPFGYTNNESYNIGTINCNVPCGRSSIYYAQWTTLFNDYIETPAGYSISVSSSNDSWGTAEVIQAPTCSENAMIGATAACGYYFVRWSDGNTDNPRTMSLTEDTYLVAEFASSYNLPDTVFVHDTTIINNYLHDTTYLPIYLYDTVPVVEYLNDTIFLPQYIHDTTIVNNYLHDSIYLPTYIHDTTFLPVHDTTYITLHDTTIVNHYLLDTIYLPQYIHDTTFIPVHDTTYINVPVHDTTIVTDTVIVSVHDTTYITQTDTLTVTQYDTIDNYIHDTLTITDTLWLTQYDTILIHDTIFIHDTIVVGVGDVETVNAKIYTNNRQIVVEGADGNDVCLYDINGRILATKQDYGVPIRFDAPASGTYIIKIGNYPVRKVVVIR